MKAYIDVAVRNMTTRRAHKRAVKEAVRCALELAGARGNGEVSVVMVSERAIRALEREWKGEDKVTDVLSFRFAEGGRAGARNPGEAEPLGGNCDLSPVRIRAGARAWRTGERTYHYACGARCHSSCRHRS